MVDSVDGTVFILRHFQSRSANWLSVYRARAVNLLLFLGAKEIFKSYTNYCALRIITGMVAVSMRDEESIVDILSPYVGNLCHARHMSCLTY